MKGGVLEPPLTVQVTCRQHGISLVGLEFYAICVFVLHGSSNNILESQQFSHQSPLMSYFCHRSVKDLGKGSAVALSSLEITSFLESLAFSFNFPLFCNSEYNLFLSCLLHENLSLSFISLYQWYESHCFRLFTVGNSEFSFQ